MTNSRYTLNIQLFSCEGSENIGGTGENNADAEQISANLDTDFDELIKNKYKKQFTKKTQEIIDKRFKETKELESYRASVKDSVSFLMSKYGLKEGEEDSLLDILKGENTKPYPHESQSEENADDSIDYEQKDAPKENEENIESLLSDSLREKLSSLLDEAKALKEEYPNFDLRKELRESPILSKLILNGLPLKTAFNTVHHDEILEGAMTYTAKKVKENMVNNFSLKGQRPIENGSVDGSGVVTSVDVNSLTSQDILKILKQVEKGASIKF